MSTSNSPYLHPEDDINNSLEQALRPLSSTIAPSNIDTLDDSSMFGPSIYSTVSQRNWAHSIELRMLTYLKPITYSTYDSDFQSLFQPVNVCGSDNVQLPPYQSHQLPTYWGTSVSEASDYSDLTPISLRPPIDLKGTPPPPTINCHLSPVANHIEYPSPIRPRSTLINIPTTPISPTTPKRRSSLFGMSLPPLSPRTPEPRRIMRDGLGIEVNMHPTPMASPKPQQTPHQTPYQTPFQTPYQAPHQIMQRTPSFQPLGDAVPPPPPRRFYANIAPKIGMRHTQNGKRSLSVDDETDAHNKKRRLSVSSSPPSSIDINEEDSFLLRLKDDELLSWKDIATRFQTDLGKAVQIPALQMRLKRLRERLMVWRDPDVQALKMAHDFWIASKYEIISNKVCHFTYILILN